MEAPTPLALVVQAPKEATEVLEEGTVLQQQGYMVPGAVPLVQGKVLHASAS